MVGVKAETMEVRYATQADARNFYGGDDPIMTFRGAVVADGDEVIAIGGMYREREKIIAFSDFKEGALKYKREIIKATNLAVKLLDRYREVYVVVTPETGRPTSHSFITHYGFKEIPGRPGVYIWRKEQCR
jgi:archaellin